MTKAERVPELQCLAWLLGAILFLGSAYFYQDPEWNGNSRLDLTRAIVEHGTLEIDAYHDAPGWATGDKAFYGGHYYSDKAIGASVMAVPVYYALLHLCGTLGMIASSSVVKHVLTTSVMGAMFTLGGLSMYTVALRIMAAPWKALIPTLAVSFGTMLWPYSAVFYGHLPAATFLTLAFALLFRASESQSPWSRTTWFWTGFAVSMAFLSDYTSALVIVGLGTYGLYALRRLNFSAKVRTASTAIPGLLIPLLILFVYNISIYGRPLAFGYTYEVEERFQQIMSLGLMGIRVPTIGAFYHITFDPKFGLFWLSPVLLLAPVGYFFALRDQHHRAESLLSLYSIAAIFIMNAASFLWYGGSSFGPRLVISALPFFIVPLALLPDHWMRPLTLLGAVATANMLIPLLGQIQYTRLEFRPDRGGFFVDGTLFRGFSLLYGYGLPQAFRLARSGQSPWTLGSALGLPLWFSAALLVAGESVLICAFRRIIGSMNRCVARSQHAGQID
jgi:hypothetical protein